MHSEFMQVSINRIRSYQVKVQIVFLKGWAWLLLQLELEVLPHEVVAATGEESGS